MAGSARGKKLPSIQLKDAAGASVSLESVTGRRSQVLALLDGCEACLRLAAALEEAEPRFSEEEGALLAVLSEAEKPDSLGPKLLRDQRGLLAQSLGIPGHQQVLIADRYGQIWADLDARAMPLGSLIEEAAGWLHFIGLQCPECGVPDVPTP